MPRLRALRDAGVSVAIDDFGTGYSNFGYLTELPVNVLKLDRSLVTGIATKTGMQMRAEAVVRLANALGYRTVAEGIEHADEIALLRSWGCDEAQGICSPNPWRRIWWPTTSNKPGRCSVCRRAAAVRGCAGQATAPRRAVRMHAPCLAMRCTSNLLPAMQQCS